MPGLDFSREAVPHVRGQSKPVFSSETDTFTRKQLLPLLFSLDETQRARFDERLLAHYAPEVEKPSRFAAQVIIRQLDIDELQHTAKVIENFLGQQ